MPFTELYNTNGDKIGQDKDGNGGKVSIVSNSKDAKRISKEYKKGATATQDDVNSGFQTTKAVISEVLDVIDRTNDNGGLREERSTVMDNGTICRGDTGGEPTYQKTNGVTVQTAKAGKSNVPGGANMKTSTSIHSHPLEIAEDDGQYFPQSASIPSGDDRVSFSSNGSNIIAGKIGTLSTIEKGSDGKIKDTRSTGAVFYTPGGNTRFSLTQKAMEKIVK